ncbi:hypothetical protein GPDM_01040 [Planococcus donghaensis MPA1U2]|uniref:Uncharacterized protein n=1 Tax=Planococcus donghaensis MPA1U2 TaxID=933115 RepID=E7RCP4_9BACL|nr:hypothetical protein [Planococcus donghaensis]EGA91409.1 hypothetical protein GPDM_01040 [Planococcus donghaensis MPA1U2]
MQENLTKIDKNQDDKNRLVWIYLLRLLNSNATFTKIPIALNDEQEFQEKFQEEIQEELEEINRVESLPIE